MIVLLQIFHLITVTQNLMLVKKIQVPNIGNLF